MPFAGSRHPMLHAASHAAEGVDLLRRSAASGTAGVECRDVLDRLLRQTVISRLRLAHPAELVTQPSDEAGRMTGLKTRTRGAAALSLRGSTETGFDRRHRRDCLPGDTIAAESSIDEEQVDRLATVLRCGGQAEVDRIVESMIEEECGLDVLFMDVVCHVELRLRRLAVSDGDPAGTALGHWRLQELVERLAPRLQDVPPTQRHGRRVLLATLEQTERLRLQVAAECLGRAGWETWCEPQGAVDELLEMVRCDWFALVLVASDALPVDTLAGTIRALRRASCNPELRVLVMSAALARRPDRMARLGADAAAGTVRQATIQTQRLLALMPAPI